MNLPLFDNYSFSIAENTQEFSEYFSQNRPLIFEDNLDVNILDLLNNIEKEKLKVLNSCFNTVYKLRIYIYHNNEKIGWFYGEQKDAETFYMINTAIIKQYQNKGIYTALLPKILDILKEKGFQKVYSRHKATNNQIIIPKLKHGFVITNFEISDVFGVLIHLTYYFNDVRKKIVDFRVGKSKPNDELKNLLSF